MLLLISVLSVLNATVRIVIYRIDVMSVCLGLWRSYVRLHKSLAGRYCNKKSGGFKTPSSPMTIAPVDVSLSDVDDRILAYKTCPSH